MKKEELDAIQVILLKEKIKRDRISCLQLNKDVEEYLNLVGIERQRKESLRDILLRILDGYKLTNTNNIWVLTSAFKRENDKYDEDCYTYLKDTFVLDNKADGRKYMNLENLDINIAFFNKKFNYDLVKDFEEKNVVINPRLTNEKLNGFLFARSDFVMDSINYGEERAKEKLLKKYKKI